MTELDKPRPRLSTGRKVLFSFLAVVCFLLLSELILFGVARIAYYQTVSKHNPQRSEKDGEVFRIVTFGDSVTAGQGTAPQYSYPRQLEKLLQENNPGGKFEVINNGVYALNSSRTADLLPGWLEEFDPDLIVVMAGCNNAWNYRNSHLKDLDLSLTNVDEEAEDESALRPVLDLLDKTRTYRALRVLRGRFVEGDKDFLKGLDENPEPVLRDQMQISETVRPAVDPTAQTNERQKKMLMNESALDQLLEHDLKLIMSTAADHGVSVIVMTYPFQPPYQDHGGVTLATAEEAGVMTIDNYAEFERLKKANQSPRIELFSADRGHPNAKGYRVIAAQVYDVMRENASRLAIELAPTPDPLAPFKDPAYLEALYAEVKLSSERSDADEYVFETLGHIAMERGDDAAAAQAFRTAFDKSGGAPQFYESLGNLHVRNKDWDALDNLQAEMLEARGDRSDIEFLIKMFEAESRRGRQGLPTGDVGGWGKGPGGGQGGGQGQGPGSGPEGGPGRSPYDSQGQEQEGGSGSGVSDQPGAGGGSQGEGTNSQTTPSGDGGVPPGG